MVKLTRALLILLIAACGDDDGKTPTVTTPPTDESLDADEDTPPQSAADMKDWLAAGHYLEWNCEESAHDQRGSSPHGRNRICTNDLLSNNEAALYPKGAAGVKELYSGTDINGYAVFLKIAAGEGGDKWYWYEILGTRIVADGTGDSGNAKNGCVSCHQTADKDQVFTQVK